MSVIIRELIAETAGERAPEELLEFAETLVSVFGREEAREQMRAFWESLWRTSRSTGGLAQMLAMVRFVASAVNEKKGGVS